MFSKNIFNFLDFKLNDNENKEEKKIKKII